MQQITLDWITQYEDKISLRGSVIYSLTDKVNTIAGQFCIAIHFRRYFM